MREIRAARGSLKGIEKSDSSCAPSAATAASAARLPAAASASRTYNNSTKTQNTYQIGFAPLAKASQSCTASPDEVQVTSSFATSPYSKLASRSLRVNLGEGVPQLRRLIQLGPHLSAQFITICFPQGRLRLLQLAEPQMARRSTQPRFRKARLRLGWTCQTGKGLLDLCLCCE